MNFRDLSKGSRRLKVRIPSEKKPGDNVQAPDEWRYIYVGPKAMEVR